MWFRLDYFMPRQDIYTRAGLYSDVVRQTPQNIYFAGYTRDEFVWTFRYQYDATISPSYHSQTCGLIPSIVALVRLM